MRAIGVVGLTPDVEQLLGDLLADWGYAMHPFRMHAAPATVLGDVHLDGLVVGGHPLVNLPAVVQHLREQPATAALPVLLLSTSELAPPQLAGLDPVEPVLMPFSLDELSATLARLLRETV